MYLRTKPLNNLNTTKKKEEAILLLSVSDKSVKTA